MQLNTIDKLKGACAGIPENCDAQMNIDSTKLEFEWMAISFDCYI